MKNQSKHVRTTKRRLVLSSNADAKTVKGLKLGFLTGIMYFMPSDFSGYQVCPLAKTAECEKPCLNEAGRGAMNSVQAARKAKTIRFFEDYENFMLDLEYSIGALIRKAKREGLTPLVRLNGTSDIRFENYAFTGKDGKEYANMMERFPDITYYDYTKIANRRDIPKNYDLTFSYSGVKAYQKNVAKAALNSALSRIAVVFDKAENIPKTFLGRDVLIGDNSDVRHLDKSNSIVALYAKGKAKHDTSGFVVRA